MLAFFSGLARTNHRPGVERPEKNNSIPEHLAPLRPVGSRWLVQGHEDEGWEDRLEKD